MTDFDKQYTKLMLKILLLGHKVNKTYELNNTKLVIKDISNPILNVRNISRKYLLKELLCYFSASNKLLDFKEASEFWSKLSDDNITINSAYGYIIFEKYYDQLKQVIDILKNDINSRRAIINISVPNKDRNSTKDEPCTIALHFICRKNKLNMTVYMRSNDLYFGLPYDATFFMYLQQYVADMLSVNYGNYIHYSTSSHIYFRDKQKLIHNLLYYISRKKQKQSSLFQILIEAINTNNTNLAPFNYILVRDNNEH